MYEKIDKNLYTPMIRQYLDIKEKYQDMIVFFRLGDFYEMFFNDAIVASKELEITLTGKDAGTNVDRVPMCGIPYHAVDNYIEKLSEKGYKIVIVEQFEDVIADKKIVRREVTRIITPGTNIDQVYLSEKNNNYIGCIDKIGLSYIFSYIELSTGEARITKLPLHNEMVINEISNLSIKELVVSNSVSDHLKNQLASIYGVMISPNEDINIDSYLLTLIEELNDNIQICAKRLLNYIISTQKRVLVHLQKFNYYNINDYLRLTNKTVKNLELIESINQDRHRNNLFAVLDKCSTAMGSRYLKKSIIFPLININKINERLDLITELHKNYLLLPDIKKNLREVYDLERIIGRISFNNPSPRDLIQLKKSLEVVPSIKKSLNKFKGKISNNISNELETFDDLYTELNKALNDDAPYLLKDGGVIKNGYNKELDDIRNIESTNKDFLTNLELREKEKTGIKNLRVGYNRVFGYFIEVTNSYLPLIKDEFGYIRKQTTSNSERFITQELKERETLILRSSETALNMEYELFNSLKKYCQSFTQRLQILANKISYLDMMISLATVAKENNYVKPEISLYDEYEIIGGRHPIIEKFNNNEFIPNDLSLSNFERILLITGPNMSGKSTYMRQNAIIAIMAQMGSFVPCEKAIIPIFDQIFTRIGSSDDITSGESTFMTEMIEVNDALQNATARSLIILDEVGRGTATYDGMALAQAIIEYIHEYIGAKTLFSTHYHELTNLENSLKSLINVHVEANSDNFNETGELIFLHKVLPGKSMNSYGINVASLAGIPQKVTYRANDILNKIVENNQYDSDKLSIDNYVEPKIINNLNPNEQYIVDEIKKVDVNKLTPMDALIFINKLKEKVDN